MKQQQFLFTFFTFFLISLVVFFLSEKNLLVGPGFLGNALFPIERAFYSLTHISFSHGVSQAQRLQEENAALRIELSNLQNVKADNQALRDQFESTTLPSRNLLPASIIGAPVFLPGISLPENFISDVGQDDGVLSGSVAIYKNVLIGIVTSVSTHTSLIQLTSNSSSSITAQDQITGALGIVKGLGSGQVVFDNVGLSDQLHVGDTIITGPGQNKDGKGYSPGLILGIITSVEKKPASLFQKAFLKSLYQVEKLRMVFIMK